MMMVRSTSSASEPSAPVSRGKTTTGIKKGASQLDKVFVTLLRSIFADDGHVQAREKLNQDLEASGGDPE